MKVIFLDIDGVVCLHKDILASGNTDGTCRILFAADDAEIGSLVH